MKHDFSIRIIRRRRSEEDRFSQEVTELLNDGYKLVDRYGHEESESEIVVGDETLTAILVRHQKFDAIMEVDPAAEPKLNEHQTVMGRAVIEAIAMIDKDWVIDDLIAPLNDHDQSTLVALVKGLHADLKHAKDQTDEDIPF